MKKAIAFLWDMTTMKFTLSVDIRVVEKLVLKVYTKLKRWLWA